MSRLALLLPILPLLVLGPIVAAGDDGAAKLPELSERFKAVAQFEVDVQEISGMTPVPSDDPALRVFLAVSDEGRCKVDAPVVEGSVFRVAFRMSGDASVAVADITPVALHLGEHVDRLDPLWAKLGGWSPDLESCVPLPGTSDLYLLGGERGAEDAYDGGANRMYVIRYPAGGPDRAELLSYLRMPDMDDDTINDRLEAVVAVPTDAPDTWHVFAFKERTAAVDRFPGYFPLRLTRTADGFGISASSALRGRRRLPTLLPSRDRLASQADACVASDGSVWVLDRWRREIHVARVADGVLAHETSLDYFDTVKDVSGETGTTDPAAPGGRYGGYGCHEALCFDGAGWLWLAADRGGGKPSVVTVLAPRGDDMASNEGR